MIKKVIITFAYLVITGLFSFSAFSIEPPYPDLTPEYLQSFAPGSKYIIESGKKSEIVRVYDGKTGKFLFTADTNGIANRAELLRLVHKQAAQFDSGN